jgi:outer membrane receptor for ferric coprogen and ferric-rhodotorulic acid
MSASRPFAPRQPAERRLNTALRHALMVLALGGLASTTLPAFAAGAASLDAAGARAYDRWAARSPPSPSAAALRCRSTPH